MDRVVTLPWCGSAEGLHTHPSYQIVRRDAGELLICKIMVVVVFSLIVIGHEFNQNILVVVNHVLMLFDCKEYRPIWWIVVYWTEPVLPRTSNFAKDVPLVPVLRSTMIVEFPHSIYDRFMLPPAQL